MNEAMYSETLEWICTGETKLDTNNAAAWLSNSITEACDASMPRIKPHKNNSIYWWSQEIAIARRECNKKRRQWQKAKKKKNKALSEIVTLEDTYRTAKRDLNVMIRRAKSKSWQELINDLDRDSWGLPYRIVLNKLRRSQLALTKILEEDVLCNTIDKLFPQDAS